MHDHVSVNLLFTASDDHCEPDRMHACTELHNALDDFPQEAFDWKIGKLYKWLTAKDRHIATHGEDNCGLDIDQIRIIDWAYSFIERCANGTCTCRLDRIEQMVDELARVLGDTGMLYGLDGRLLMLPTEVTRSALRCLIPLGTIDHVEVDFDGKTGTLTVATEDGQTNVYDLLRFGIYRLDVYTMLCGIENIQRGPAAWSLARRVRAIGDGLEVALLHRRQFDVDRYTSIAMLLEETRELAAELTSFDRDLAVDLLTNRGIRVDDLAATVRRIAA